MNSRVTLIAAIVLGACFVLPLSTCTRYVDAKGDAVEVEEGATPPAGAVAIVDYQVPAEQLWSNTVGGLLMLVAFLGPLACALHARFGKSARAKRVVFWLQPLLLLAAGHYVWVIAGFGRPTAAAWLAGAAVAALALCWLAAFVPRPAASP
jgi:hypothetical protein